MLIHWHIFCLFVGRYGWKTVERYVIWFVFLIVYSGGGFWCPYWNWFAIKTKTTFLRMKEIASTNPHLELDLCQYAFPFYVIEIVFCIVICLYQCIQIIVSFAQCTLSKANVLVSFLLTFWDWTYVFVALSEWVATRGSQGPKDIKWKKLNAKYKMFSQQGVSGASGSQWLASDGRRSTPVHPHLKKTPQPTTTFWKTPLDLNDGSLPFHRRTNG